MIKEIETEKDLALVLSAYNQDSSIGNDQIQVSVELLSRFISDIQITNYRYGQQNVANLVANCIANYR